MPKGAAAKRLSSGRASRPPSRGRGKTPAPRPGSEDKGKAGELLPGRPQVQLIWPAAGRLQGQGFVADGQDRADIVGGPGFQGLLPVNRPDAEPLGPQYLEQGGAAGRGLAHLDGPALQPGK